MGANSKIDWTDATWNPVVGCTRISTGCEHCYAERLVASRLSTLPRYRGLAERTAHGPQWTGQVRVMEHRLQEPLSWRKPRRVFVNSLSDLFHESLPFETIERVFAVINKTVYHQFQILTKRAKSMMEFMEWYSQRVAAPPGHPDWIPPTNVWMGVSVENQRYAEDRLPHLLATPTWTRWISAEPLLGPLDLTPWLPHMQWVVVGAESGPGRRPMDLDWVRDIRDQCLNYGVAFFLKQTIGDDGRVIHMPELDGRTWTEYP